MIKIYNSEYIFEFTAFNEDVLPLYAATLPASSMMNAIAARARSAKASGIINENRQLLPIAWY
ncbi:hypothetical protein CHS0354_020433 [Potamilus streckersoni]|uniref:Uncharacterized protein n=1 Tax=Potamilus streckersoni TaxID=2493646 RepID=A0AAE0SM41_9BIVA|nr:hypothetical protein CHS0354_020433 [Potamilus streckersoni]